MKIIYFILSISFVIIFIANFSWVIFNLYMFVINGIESITSGQTLIENVYYSKFLRWLILADVVWIISTIAYILKRKSYKTDHKFTLSTKFQNK